VGWKTTSAPAIAPVSVAEAKDHLRVVASDEDDYIRGLIFAAVEWCQEHTERQFLQSTIEYILPTFANPLWLPRPSLVSVTSVQYRDSDGTYQTVAATEYDVDTYSKPGAVRLAYSKSWPTPQSVFDGVKITYTAGYGAAPSSVPEPIQAAIKLLVANLYEHREPIVSATVLREVKFTLTALLAPYRIPSIR